MVPRRSFLAMTAGGLLVPGRLRAAPRPVEHKFLFLFCSGGWDTSKVFTPDFESGNVDMADSDAPASVNGIAYCESPRRPNVSTFFEAYGDRACVLNGIEVRSITHERCNRIILTGGGDAGRDDWPSTIAALSSENLLAPHLVIIGYAYTSAYTSSVVRVGNTGQLPVLLDGSTLATQSDTPLVLPSSATLTRADAYVQARAAAYLDGAGPGREARYAAQYANVLDQIRAFTPLAPDLDLTAEVVGCQRDTAADCGIALSCFESGISRCAMVRYHGECNAGWDTHSNNDDQDAHFDGLFGFLSEIMADLDGRFAVDGSRLADHTTIVVLSEMGRTPRLNDSNGRDHWTYTSAMLLGGGVQGGRVIGALDEYYLGRSVDLASGDVTETGARLVPGHLGATLLALADVDPADAGLAEAPILAALR